MRYRKADATASFSRKITFSSDPYVDELGLLSAHATSKYINVFGSFAGDCSHIFGTCSICAALLLVTAAHVKRHSLWKMPPHLGVRYSAQNGDQKVTSMPYEITSQVPHYTQGVVVWSAKEISGEMKENTRKLRFSHFHTVTFS